jgi:hypothetical protein
LSYQDDRSENGEKRRPDVFHRDPPPATLEDHF